MTQSGAVEVRAELAAEAIIFSFLGSRHFKVVSSKILSHLIVKVLLHLNCFVNGTTPHMKWTIAPCLNQIQVTYNQTDRQTASTLYISLRDFANVPCGAQPQLEHICRRPIHFSRLREISWLDLPVGLNCRFWINDLRLRNSHSN